MRDLYNTVTFRYTNLLSSWSRNDGARANNTNIANTCRWFLAIFCPQNLLCAHAHNFFTLFRTCVYLSRKACTMCVRNEVLISNQPARCQRQRRVRPSYQSMLRRKQTGVQSERDNKSGTKKKYRSTLYPRRSRRNWQVRCWERARESTKTCFSVCCERNFRIRNLLAAIANFCTAKTTNRNL